ncbi:unnamed protein product [Phyllotreta striolata]|uniref:DNA polymerase epsilon subunit 3 n=1 Tax=Phyllotreta striolata TaxID=444603 RepID=A0A9N9TGK9_PHYSR|nr:unnamed protein product [Phyllotreta striolata]
MAEKLDDLNLPNASVQKIIKEVLPDSVNIGKDARSALSRAASVFVLYVTSQASNEAQKGNRKTLTPKDVMTALTELEFENFIEPLEEALIEYKNSRSKKGKGKKSIEGNDTDDIDDQHETAEDDLKDDE